MFRKVLVANRGEIACRIIRTCQKLGIQTVAIASDVDQAMPHMRLADEGYVIGGAAPVDSYLNVEVIVALAQRVGAEAIHPGYGFLSENPEFARAVRAAGIVFIGPDVSAIETMGSKSQAKALAQKIGVPTIPGYQGEDQSIDALTKAAQEIGYPVMIKAAMGGGGKGMRRVLAQGDFAHALASAQREALSAFGDDRMLLEKALLAPRHIEIQVVGDTHGQIFTVGSRDCSLQRRHQKIIEEAPAVGLSPEMAENLARDARSIAQAVNYVGAGTVEFLVDGDQYFFLEMNTRLQVEHPVTEFVFARDLVEAQLRVASGEKLSWRQEALQPKGHAIEVRLCAEDPHNDFLPNTGYLSVFQMPEITANVRVDAGYASGDQVPSHYDPLIAKIIVWDRTRDLAMKKLSSVLAQTHLQGIAWNGGFLMSLVNGSPFSQTPQDVTFLDQWIAGLTTVEWSEHVYVLGALAYYQHLQRQRQGLWSALFGWQPNRSRGLSCVLNDQFLTVSPNQVEWGDRCWPVGKVSLEEDLFYAVVDNEALKAQVSFDAHCMHLRFRGVLYQLHYQDIDHIESNLEESDGHLLSPMPGRIVSVLVNNGQAVEKSTPLMILEAMKMEHTIRAPFAGAIETIHFHVGDQVQEGVELLSLKPAA